MKKEFELYGIFGHPLAHTLSPLMQEAGFRALGRKAFYRPFDISEKDYRRILSARSRLILDGFNVTVPYKEITARGLDARTREAREVGAVNTVFRRRGRWIGTNTDVWGFCRSVAKDGAFRIAGTNAVVLGAGGAARAVVYGLAAQKAARILILNRHPERAQKIARDFKRLFPQVLLTAGKLEEAQAKKALTRAMLVVNATSLGLKATDPAVLESGWVPRAGKPALYYDLIYKPAQTPFLRLAQRKGHRTLNGTGMLLYQGVKAFECWTGRKAPEAAMRRALASALKKGNLKQT